MDKSSQKVQRVFHRTQQRVSTGGCSVSVPIRGTTTQRVNREHSFDKSMNTNPRGSGDAGGVSMDVVALVRGRP